MLSQATVDLLRQYKDWYNTFKKINSNRWIGKEDRIFTSIHGSYMHPDSCTHILRKIISKHNLEPMRFHDLRHSCASLLINAGVDPKTVSDRLGHVDTSITMRIYTHIYEMSKMKCAEKMNDIFERKIYV
jgi:integrase